MTRTIIAAVVFSVALTAAPDDKKQGAKSTQQATKATDPVCGMEVDTRTADKATYQGKTYYFCNREEKVDFEKNPAKYVKATKKSTS